MFSRALGALAVISVGANAFLLLPNVNSDDLSTFVNPKSQAIKLPCPDCVFPSKGDGKLRKEAQSDDGDEPLFWVQGGARDVILNFSLSEDDRAIMVNDWQVYPITLDNSGSPTIVEVAASVSLADAQEHPEEATSLEVSGASIFINEEVVSTVGDKVVKVQYQVVSLEGQPISVDGAEVKLLEGTDGSLMIISVEGVKRPLSVFDPMPPPPPHGNEKQCDMLPAALCRWKGLFDTKVNDLKQGLPHKLGGKGCGGRKRPQRLPGHIKPHFDHFEHDNDEAQSEDGQRPSHHHGRPPHPDHFEPADHLDHPHGPHRGPHGVHKGGPSPHGHHHHGPHHRHFLHRFFRAFVSVLVPVVAGITMGMFVSLLGMATGRMIAFLWIKFRRGGKRGYASVAQTHADDEPQLEKGVVELVEEEPLPVYEAAPAYEGTAKETEKK